MTIDAPSLTLRQRQLAALVSQGKTNKQIALALHLAEGTVKMYLHALYPKVGVLNRAGLGVWAAYHPEAINQ
jgi:two-component system nitrate/nitrite response regulator NarP